MKVKNKWIALLMSVACLLSMALMGACAPTNVDDTQKPTPTPVVKAVYLTYNNKDIEGALSVDLAEGSLQLSAQVDKDEGADGTLTYTSSKTAVATVANSGLITLVDVGETIITATAGEKSSAFVLQVGFAKEMQTVTVYGGSADKSGAEEGEYVTLTPTTPKHKDFVRWDFSGEIDWINGNTFRMPNQSVTVTAVYTDTLYNLDVIGAKVVEKTPVATELKAVNTAVQITGTTPSGGYIFHRNTGEDAITILANNTEGTIIFPVYSTAERGADIGFTISANGTAYKFTNEFTLTVNGTPVVSDATTPLGAQWKDYQFVNVGECQLNKGWNEIKILYTPKAGKNFNIRSMTLTTEASVSFEELSKEFFGEGESLGNTQNGSNPEYDVVRYKLAFDEKITLKSNVSTATKKIFGWNYGWNSAVLENADQEEFSLNMVGEDTMVYPLYYSEDEVTATELKAVDPRVVITGQRESDNRYVLNKNTGEDCVGVGVNGLTGVMTYKIYATEAGPARLGVTITSKPTTVKVTDVFHITLNGTDIVSEAKTNKGAQWSNYAYIELTSCMLKKGWNEIIVSYTPQASENVNFRSITLTSKAQIGFEKIIVVPDTAEETVFYATDDNVVLAGKNGAGKDVLLKVGAGATGHVGGNAVDAEGTLTFKIYASSAKAARLKFTVQSHNGAEKNFADVYTVKIDGETFLTGAKIPVGDIVFNTVELGVFELKQGWNEIVMYYTPRGGAYHDIRSMSLTTEATVSFTAPVA